MPHKKNNDKSANSTFIKKAKKVEYFSTDG